MTRTNQFGVLAAFARTDGGYPLCSIGAGGRGGNSRRW